MSVKKLEGEVIHWVGSYGFIRVITDDGSVSSYFVHFKKCVNLNSEQVPVIGTKARFNPAPAFAEGKAPEAINVEFESVRPKNQNKPVVSNEGGIR